MSLFDFLSLGICVLCCGVGIYAVLVAGRERSGLAARLRVGIREGEKTAWTAGRDAGVESMMVGMRRVLLERAESSANGVTVCAELVGGIADGAQVVVGKDQDFVWVRVLGRDVVYLFAHRSCEGRWVYECWDGELGNRDLLSKQGSGCRNAES